MWTAIQYVGTPLALVAFVVAVGAWVVRSRIKTTRELIEKAPEDDRADLIRRTLETYSITDDNLTREQKFNLLSKVIDQRASRFRMVALCSVLIAVITAVTVVAVTIYSPGETEPGSNETSVHPQSEQEQFLIIGDIESERDLSGLPVRIGLLWGIEDDRYHYFGDFELTDGAPEEGIRFEIRIPNQSPPDEALMFINNAMVGISDPGLFAKIGVAYVIAFIDKNGSTLYEHPHDEMIGAASNFVVTYFWGTMPENFAKYWVLRPGLGIAEAVPPEQHGFDTRRDLLRQVSSKTRVRVHIPKKGERVVLPDWT